MLKHSEEDMDDRQMVDFAWRRYSRQIYKLCEAKCGPGDDAKDLFQTVALKFCQNVEKLLNRQNMFPWLFTVLQHAYLDHLAANRRACLMSRVSEPAVEYGSFREEDSMCHEVGPDVEMLIFLEESLKILTPLERMLVEMKYYGGFSVSEISRIIGLSENAVRKRRYIAFQKIRRRLEEYSSEPKIA